MTLGTIVLENESQLQIMNKEDDRIYKNQMTITYYKLVYGKPVGLACGAWPGGNIPGCIQAEYNGC